MNDGWIDIKEKLPPDKTWVEAKFKIGTSEMEIEWFYFAEYYRSSEFEKRRITHWRFITHPFFNPIIEKPSFLELPINEIR